MLQQLALRQNVDKKDIYDEENDPQTHSDY